MAKNSSSTPENKTKTAEDVVDSLPTTEALPSPTADAINERKDDSKVSTPETNRSVSNSKKRGLSESAKDNEPSNKKLRETPPASSANGEVKSPSFPSPSDHPATTFDKETWQGFCDIESEPAYFSVILREMGVQGVTVREVFAMDPALLEMLPQPIHGLILLFNYREFAKEDQATTCPPNVWFANQLPAQSSCATLAMINILMNSSAKVDVGEHLKQFKDFTRDFTPYQRGEALSSFDFVKKIHNSFAKKMDILESDKHLSYKVNKAARLKRQQLDTKNIKKGKGTKSRPRRESAESSATDDSAQDYEENAHHYIAFVPVGTEVWKLDGLDAQPTSMGTFDTAAGETWLSAVSDTIATLMAAGDDDYGVIALTESPLGSLRKQACEALSTLSTVELRLDSLDETWRSFLSDDNGTEDTPPLPIALGIHPADVQKTTESLPTDLSIATALLPALLDRRTSLVRTLNHLANSIIPEIQAEADEDQKAARRRYDTGPVIKKWLEMLAANGHLAENLERFMPAAATAAAGSVNGKRKGEGR